MNVETQNDSHGFEGGRAGTNSANGHRPLVVGPSGSVPRPPQRIRGAVYSVRRPSVERTDRVAGVARRTPRPVGRGSLGNPVTAGLLVFGAGLLLGAAAGRGIFTGWRAMVPGAVRGIGRRRDRCQRILQPGGPTATHDMHQPMERKV